MIEWQRAESIFAALPLGPELTPRGLVHRSGPWGFYHHGPIYRPSCEDCPLRFDPKVFPDGVLPAPMVFVGEEPGDTEVGQGYGFCGASGKLLWFIAQHGAGFDRHRIWTTNAALCKARSIVLANGAELPLEKVKALAAKACRKRLLAEILYVTQGQTHPTIQPLGNWALWSTTGMPEPSTYGYRGSRIDIDLEALYLEVVSNEPSASALPTKLSAGKPKGRRKKKR